MFSLPEPKFGIFQSDREGDIALYSQLADGGGIQRLTKPDNKESHIPDSWSDDGRMLTFTIGGLVAGTVWSLRTGDAAPKPLQGTQLPSGNLPYQVYVEPFPPTGARYQISTPSIQQ